MARASGSQMADARPLERMRLSRAIEAEVRERYRDGIRGVETDMLEREEATDYFPVEVIFIGGDDICLCVHPGRARAFLSSFFAQDRGSLRWAGIVLLHSTGQHELARLQEARRRLMGMAKRAMRDDISLARSLVMARLVPLKECAAKGGDVEWFDQVRTTRSVEEALGAWPDCGEPS